MTSSVSDLAPFVASILQDQVMEDLKKERDELKDCFFKIEITGKGGTPVYASGNFDEGCYSTDIRTLEEKWLCHLETHSKCPLRDLRFVEVRLAGDVQFALSPKEHDDVWCYAGMENAAKHSAAKDLQFFKGGYGADFSALCVDVYNWLDSDWRRLVERTQWKPTLSQAVQWLERLQNARECEVQMSSIMFQIGRYDALIRKALRMFDRNGLKSKDRQSQHEEAQAVADRINRILPTGCGFHGRICTQYVLARKLNIKQTGSELEQVLPPLVKVLPHQANTSNRCKQKIRELDDMNTDIFPLAKDDPNRSEKLDLFVTRLQEMNQQRQQALSKKHD